MKINNGKDFWAGLMFMGFGLGFLGVAMSSYAMGTAVRMGPAYFPTVLGGMLAVLGAIIGAYALSAFEGDVLKPYVSGYLIIMGLVIIAKAFFRVPPKNVTTHLTPLGFFGALVDAMGGGGWGPIVASNLIVRGNDVRITVGSVNAVEFFVTLAASITFLLTIGLTHWTIILGLALGGVIAAPIGAWAAKRIPHKPFMILVGVLVTVVSARNLLKAFALI